MRKVFFLSLLIIVLDQAIKIYVKTHFEYYQSKEIFDWFKITFVENPGMAYGFQMGGYAGKIILTILRLGLIAFIGFWINSSLKRNNSNWFVIPMSLIFAGAVGNLIDSIFYGVLFDTGIVYNFDLGQWERSYPGVSKLDFSGYSTWFAGVVVDMFSFTFEGLNFTLPSFLPFLGGKTIGLFDYIFNLADASISIGVVLLLLNQKKAFKNIHV
ncbi:MAG: lipoprotein signal peptidase [Flavobacteriaceae bacterium]|nr:MAG: lipoprotein signal peptidase [Flavobacteriaceae bacterium]